MKEKELKSFVKTVVDAMGLDTEGVEIDVKNKGEEDEELVDVRLANGNSVMEEFMRAVEVLEKEAKMVKEGKKLFELDEEDQDDDQENITE